MQLSQGLHCKIPLFDANSLYISPSHSHSNMHQKPSLTRTMVSSTPTSTAVSDRILSTVVPANVTGDVLHELAALDLAFKLHYLRAVYYFKQSEAIENLSIAEIKEPLFLMLDAFDHVAGRVRRHESGRPHIKCNDSGVRIIEARCGLGMEEWLEMEEANREKELVYDRVLGPDLFFSPLVYLQFTRFKCGGLSIGMNWAHILGDAVSAHKTINLSTQILATKKPVPKTPNQLKPDNKITSTAAGSPLSIKKVEPVGDFWLTPTNVRMVTFSFKISESKLKHLHSKISNHVPAFEAVCAFVWKSLAKMRVGKGPNLVTIIRNDISEESKNVLGNNQTISTVSTDSSVAKLDLSEVAMLMRNSEKDEKKAIEELVERENGKEDYIVYGSNLTFVDMQEVKLYGLEFIGQKPAFVDYSIHGVGEEGVILVLPGPDEGRVLTVILPEDEIPKIKEEIGSEWGTV